MNPRFGASAPKGPAERIDLNPSPEYAQPGRPVLHPQPDEISDVFSSHHHGRAKDRSRIAVVGRRL